MTQKDDRFSQNGAKYFTLDFDAITELGLKKFAAEFAKQQAPVVAIEATNRLVKKDGLATKKATLRFENGQSITISVGSQGDIIDTKLNATVLPVREIGTMAGYVKEVAGKMADNQARFDKSLARKMRPVKDESKKRPAGRTIQGRLIEARAANVDAQTNVSTARNRVADAQKLIATSQTGLAEIQQKLEAERHIKNDLIAQIEQKGGSVE